MAIKIHAKDGRIRVIKPAQCADGSSAATERVKKSATSGALITLRDALDESEDAIDHYRYVQKDADE